MTYDPNAKRGAEIRRSQAISAAIRRNDLQRHAEERRVEITSSRPISIEEPNAGHELTVEVGPKATTEDVARAVAKALEVIA